MRIPHIISKNTLIAYDPSPESLDLIGENERIIIAENFDWNKDDCPPLADYCVETINSKFEEEPILDKLPCADRDYLLELLSLDYPLEFVIPLLDDEYYWEKRYDKKFGIIFRRKPDFWCWKSLYLERHIQWVVENAEPQYKDEENMEEILVLCSPFVRRLIVTQLQAWRPPLNWDKDEIPEKYPIQHIDFKPIFEKLSNIDEFDLIYGMNDISEKFTWDLFKISVLDCELLGKALLVLENLRILRIHKSKLEDDHCRALMQGLVNNTTIEELDLSSCSIADQGALCLAKLLEVHPVLRVLNLTNNCIGKIGAEGIGFSLLQENGCPLEVLNLRLNPLGHDGAMGIMRAIVRIDKLKQLSFAGCLFEDETALRIGDMLKVNTSLERLDISNNWFDEESVESLLSGLEVNETLQWLDVRETEIVDRQLDLINDALLKNRTGDFPKKELFKRHLESVEEETRESVETEVEIVDETEATEEEEEEQIDENLTEEPNVSLDAEPEDEPDEAAGSVTG